jgi:hypothetical protein
MGNEEFEGLEAPVKESKERVISFRVDDKTYESIVALGEKPNEWARKLVESEAAKEIPMTAGEWALFGEMARLRFLFGNAIKLLAVGKLSEKGWSQVLGEAEENPVKIAQQLIDKRRSRSGQREEGYAESEPVH